jgi:hypothetical protein
MCRSRGRIRSGATIRIEHSGIALNAAPVAGLCGGHTSSTARDVVPGAQQSPSGCLNDAK